tara:strand:- start:809 stop:1282 length:474 start_codon:yes stop_codon:yes gene_type:complete
MKYIKKKGKNGGKRPSTYLDTALTRKQMEERKRMQKKAKSAFFQQLPDNTPQEAKVARKYPGADLPYDDDAPARKKSMKKGGKFPDLNKDGKVTMADILMGRGVKKGMKGMKYEKGGKFDPRKASMMKGLEAKIKKAKGTAAAKPLIDQYRKLTGTK